MTSICMYFEVHQPIRLNKFSVFNIGGQGNHSEYFNRKLNEQIFIKVAKKCYLPTNNLLLELIRKYDGDFRVSFRILLASVIAGMATYLFLSVFIMAEWIQLASGLVLFLGGFLTIAPVVGAVSSRDVGNLRAMFSGIGILSRLLEIPLVIMEKTLRLRARRENIETL